jgi:RNA polymerase sigma factor (sigma-70 family)
MAADKQPPEGNTALFNQYYAEIQRLVNQRRSKWVLTTMPFEDVSSELMVHVWKVIHQYDVSRPFDKWCNTVLTNAIINMLRKHLFKAARPCLASGVYGVPCRFNGGDSICHWHKSPTGKQDCHCPLYAAWEKKKGVQANLSAPMSLESHTDEHHNIPSDFADTEGHKAALDKVMLKKLTKSDAKLYRLIYIRHWPIKRVAKEMGIKVTCITRTPIAITKARNRFIKMARQIMMDMDLT